MRRDEARLLDRLIAARKIQRFIAGMTDSEFLANEMAQSAVIRESQVIGEVPRVVSADTRTAYSEIDRRAVAGMRNRLVHRYFAIRLEVVWKTARDYIPALVVQPARNAPFDEESS